MRFCQSTLQNNRIITLGYYLFIEAIPRGQLAHPKHAERSEGPDNTRPQMSGILLAILATTFTCLLDLSTAQLWAHQVGFCTVILYMAYLFGQPHPSPLVIAATGNLMLDVVHHGTAGWSGIYLVPCTLLGLVLKRRLFYRTTLFHYALLASTLFLNSIFVIPLAHGNNVPLYCTIKAIIANMIVMFLFLKYIYSGEQGNRYLTTQSV